MTGARMSLLVISRYCGAAAALSEKHGAGRRAAMGSAFHAVCSGSPDAQKLMARLTESEREQVDKLHPPEDIEELGLRYADAGKELTVAIDQDGEPCEEDDPAALSVGHLDMVWIVVVNGKRVAYVADIKMSEFTVTDGTDSLQLHAYGHAFASANNCDAYCVGIWAAKEGLWQWGDIVELGSFEHLAWVEEIVHAASNTDGEYAPGNHCHGCYGRTHCQEWLLPPSVASEELAPYSTPGAITEENSYDLWTKLQRAKSTIGKIEEIIKAHAHVNGIRDGKGKVLYPVNCKGRESVMSPKELREELGQDAEAFIKQGKPFKRLTWIKEKRA